MFYYLEGTVAHTEPYIAVIDCGGVGYLCHVTTMTQSRIRQGQKARLYTHLNVREDAMEIYGFSDIEERNCFLLLVGISGVGMKVGLCLLYTSTPARSLKGYRPSGRLGFTTASAAGMASLHS